MTRDLVFCENVFLQPRYVHMKILATILLLLFYAGTALPSEQSPPVFKISSDCIVEMQVERNRYTDMWGVAITLNTDAAQKLFTLSSNHIKKLISIANGNGEVISTAVVMEPISTRVAIVLEKPKAEEIRNKIVSSRGECGV